MNVEIWADIACPWCYLGLRRFETALERFEHRDEVAIRWRSFELDPHAPREGEEVASHLAAKFGMSREDARASQRRLTDIAAADGVEVRLDLAHVANTFDAHRLVHLGAEHGTGEAVADRLMRAYHAEGEAVGSAETLARLCAELGLPAEEVDEVLAGERYASEVREDEQLAAALGIHAVPFFVVDRSLAASGAQSPEVLGELLRRAREAAPASADARP